MTSPTLARLKAVEKMSPRQLVLILLGEAKAAGSMAGYARKIAAKLPTGGSPLMEKVERSSRQQFRGLPREQMDRQIRSCQMEAMYLNHLVLVCNESVLTHADLWAARVSMLMFAGLHLAEQEDTTDEQMLTWCRAAVRHWLDV